MSISRTYSIGLYKVATSKVNSKLTPHKRLHKLRVYNPLTKAKNNNNKWCTYILVEETRFELAASWSLTRRSSKLNYSSMLYKLYTWGTRPSQRLFNHVLAPPFSSVFNVNDSVFTLRNHFFQWHFTGIVRFLRLIFPTYMADLLRFCQPQSPQFSFLCCLIQRLSSAD